MQICSRLSTSAGKRRFITFPFASDLTSCPTPLTDGASSPASLFCLLPWPNSSRGGVRYWSIIRRSSTQTSYVALSAFIMLPRSDQSCPSAYRSPTSSQRSLSPRLASCPSGRFHPRYTLYAIALSTMSAPSGSARLSWTRRRKLRASRQARLTSTASQPSARNLGPSMARALALTSRLRLRVIRASPSMRRLSSVCRASSSRSTA